MRITVAGFDIEVGWRRGNSDRLGLGFGRVRNDAAKTKVIAPDTFSPERNAIR
jgi:hypothetical protein